MKSQSPVPFFPGPPQVSLSLGVPAERCHFCPVIGGELAQGGNPVPKEKGECRGGTTSVLGCSLH